MDLAFLTPLCDRPGPWASVYVDTSRHSESTTEERSVEAFAVQRALASAGADEATGRAVRSAVDELQHTREPIGRALFAAHGEVVLDLALSTPPSARAHWAPVPRTTPLLDLAGEDPLCLVAYIDRKGADLEVRSARGAADTSSVTGKPWPAHRAASADWSERHLRLDAEHTWEHNAAELASTLANCQAETRADLLVLVGDARECAAVESRLPKQLREHTMRARHGAGSPLLDAELERARAECVAYRAERDLERFAAERGRDDAATAGVPALVDAARQHRVAELLVDTAGPDTHREVWVGDEPDQLAAASSPPYSTRSTAGTVTPCS
ncbi:Vms1/Ankzf1 family peptidyl-tRNA hydrolase, partial [Streptomyces kunmingensis]